MRPVPLLARSKVSLQISLQETVAQWPYRSIYWPDKIFILPRQFRAFGLSPPRAGGALTYRRSRVQVPSAPPFARESARILRCIVWRAAIGRITLLRLDTNLPGNPVDYFRSLTCSREGDVVLIVRIFAASSFASIANAKRLVNDLGEVCTTRKAALNARRGFTAGRALYVLI